MPAEEWADRVIAEGMRGASAGLDLEGTGRALGHAVKAIEAQAAALASMEYGHRAEKVSCPACGKKVTIEVSGADAAVVSRALAHTSGMIDDIARLQEFARGLPDHRVDHGAEFVKWMTVEEIERVQGRMRAGERP